MKPRREESTKSETQHEKHWAEESTPAKSQKKTAPPWLMLVISKSKDRQTQNLS